MDEDLKTLPGPYEIFELPDGGKSRLRVMDWKLGLIFIQTADVPAGKEVKAMRIYVTSETKPIGVNWYDITSQTLIAQLQPYLEIAGYQQKAFTITKYGVRPKARFMLEVAPWA